MPRGRPPLDDYSSVRGDDVERIMHRLLNSNFWPRELTHSRCYTRLHDDHDGTYQGKLSVVFSEDGDAWIEINGRDRVTEGLRFRMPIIGGGASPHVRMAMLLLAEAIRLDNLERPIKVPPFCRYCHSAERPDEMTEADGKLAHPECRREVERQQIRCIKTPGCWLVGGHDGHCD